MTLPPPSLPPSLPPMTAFHFTTTVSCVYQLTTVVLNLIVSVSCRLSMVAQQTGGNKLDVLV